MFRRRTMHPSTKRGIEGYCDSIIQDCVAIGGLLNTTEQGDVRKKERIRAFLKDIDENLAGLKKESEILD